MTMMVLRWNVGKKGMTLVAVSLVQRSSIRLREVGEEGVVHGSMKMILVMADGI
jgi:hypothetical protein